MARKRMIDPGFWTDEKLGTCTRDERLLFMGLISNADDDGRLPGHPALLKSMIFPYDYDITPDDVEKWAQSLFQKRLIAIYKANGQTYIWVCNFSKHQSIKKKTESKLPAPPGNPFGDGNCNSGEEVPHQLPTNGEEVPLKRKEEKRKEEKGSNQDTLSGNKADPNYFFTLDDHEKVELFKTLPVNKQLGLLVVTYNKTFPEQAKKFGTGGTITARKVFDEAVKSGVPPDNILIEILWNQEPEEPTPWELVNCLKGQRGLEQTQAQVIYSMEKYDREVGIKDYGATKARDAPQH